ncbi:MAG TPA: LodA/GoxA family CTQ-dependent oxidase, partial [Thermoanaerobaculia bacterium]|nr:LodA/GoxA family CTQ-dependent oxidase [Thermoanaerobaculia bacterium]
ITYICENPSLWAELGRLDWRTLEPGDITRHMALPWQADFSECNHRWWPAARPDDVVDQQQYEAVVKFYDENLDGPLSSNVAARVEWARGIPQVSPGLDNGMVHHWSEFGFVVPRELHGQVVYVEEERDKYAGTSLRDAFYYLMNIGAYSDFLPHAKKMVDDFLAEAKKNANDPETVSAQGMTGWNYFAYTPEGFDARMQNIYSQYVLQNSQAATGPGGYLEGTTYEQQAYRILQMAPFNQLDGAWIRQAAPPGPVDAVRNFLFHIYMDELGDAIDAHNHANVYTELLQSLNYYLPDLHSYDYAHNPALLDSAFVEPVFLLAISSFTEQYLPEILGMTLYLEWSSVGLAGVVSTLESVGIDPAYYRLHVGIDNASAGHGALAKKAIELYLDNIRAQGGDTAMQQAFERIWTGYVAFGTLGTLGQDISEQFSSPPSLTDRMVAMIQSKAEYARQNHGTKQLGPNPLNDWFDDPYGLLDELVAAGYIIPGKPNDSPIFELMSFTGPMFHVFTPAEQALWRDYITSLVPREKFPPLEIERAMQWVVSTLRQRQAGTPGHHARLTGYDPTAKATVTMPIASWFENRWGDESDFVFMGALRNPLNGWIVPGNAAASPLLTQMLSGNNDMAKAFREFVPEHVGRDAKIPGPYTCKQVLAMWTDQGCPIHGVIDDSLKIQKQQTPAKGRLKVKDGGTPEAPPAAEAPAKPIFVRPKRIYGMGMPH